MSVLRVLLATSWGNACGIAEHSAYLKEAVEAADPEIVITPIREALDPQARGDVLPDYFQVPHLQVLHLNYHRALHSRWTPEAVQRAKASGTYQAIVITFHDTFGEHPPDDLSRELATLADAFIVHEPCEGLETAIYWRMGVPAWESAGPFYSLPPFKAWEDQPVLGTVGFPFPWKNYEHLCNITRAAGWALMLIAPNATPEQIAEWRRRQPALYVRSDFVHRREVVALLTGCDATAFCYTCANSGQSGAVLQGIAARKPVFAFHTCRQFRALYRAQGATGIRWGDTFEHLHYFLQSIPITRTDPAIVALAHRDSWQQLGQAYAQLYRSLLR